MTQDLYQLPLTFEQILTLVRQLPQAQKDKVMQELEKEQSASKLDSFLEEFRTDELSLEDITAEVEAVRAVKSMPKFGSAKGKVKMSDDFDEPVEGFEEYAP